MKARVNEEIKMKQGLGEVCGKKKKTEQANIKKPRRMEQWLSKSSEREYVECEN